MIKESAYTQNIIELEIISKCFMLEIADKVDGKDVYLRNSIAKTISFLRAIDLLFIVEKYNEGWILYRALIDRLVYLYYLLDNNNFNEFDEWTYIKTFEYRHNAKVDEKFKRLINNPKFKTNKGETNKYNELKKRVNWQKPEAQKVLKSKDFDFLYKFGYDYASMHTHPMSWDGSKEFYQITGLEPNPHIETEDSLLIKNSFLVSSMILNLILINLAIDIPRFYVEYLIEIKKLALGQDNNCNQKFKETFKAFKEDAGY